MLFLIDSTSNNLNISNQNGLFYFFMIFSKLFSLFYDIFYFLFSKNNA